MTTIPRHRGARRGVAPVRAVVAVGLALGLALGLAACGGDGGSSQDAASTTSPTPSASASPAGTPASDVRVPAPSGTTTRVARGLQPARISIPAVGIDSSLTDLGIAKDDTIEVPTDFDQAGWLTTSPAPGQQGPAVIAGHVDSTTGPAVFYRLSDLAVGDPITVTRRNGSRVTFTVDGLQEYPKAKFPTAATYGPVPGPALRLITCGGAYDKSRGGYQGNVVVFAS